MNEDMWEIWEWPSGTWGTWYVQKEGETRVRNEVLVCEGLTKEQAMYRAAASGRVLVYAAGRLQRWGYRNE